jgi:CelD/BcsL family acetyltransferase involved in cellulose biosynthesis
MTGQDGFHHESGLVLHTGPAALARLAPEWDRLAAVDPSPFTTTAWLRAWWGAYGKGELVNATLVGEDGRLRAAVALRRTPAGGLAAPADDHSDDWGAVAEDDAARRELWAGVARLGSTRLVLRALRAGREATAARDALVQAGLRVHATPWNRSPYLELPDDPEELLRRQSRNLRSQVARRRRQLEKEGDVTFRTTTGGERLDADLDELFRVEGSGWKAREGTAILAEEGAERLYRAFAHDAARAGWLRVHLLEVAGRVVAGDLGCAIGDTAFLLKTGFDEEWSKLSPGLVLRAEVLRATIEDGRRGYDFLGPDDAYKLRWTPTVRPRVTLHAYRGAAALPGLAWHRAVRPALRRARDAARARAARG